MDKPNSNWRTPGQLIAEHGGIEGFLEFLQSPQFQEHDREVSEVEERDEIEELKSAINRAVVAEQEALATLRDANCSAYSKQSAMDELAAAIRGVGWRFRVMSRIIDKSGI